MSLRAGTATDGASRTSFTRLARDRLESCIACGRHLWRYANRANGEVGFVQSNLPNNQLLFDAETPIFTVGATGSGSNGRPCDWEILVFSEVLTDSDRRLLEDYLAHKWGLAKDLTIGHEIPGYGWYARWRCGMGGCQVRQRDLFRRQ